MRVARLRTGLLPALALALSAGLVACADSPRARARPPAASPPAPAAPARPAQPAPPPPPLLVGPTAALAAQAVDDTVGRPIGQALARLAERFLGRPYRAFSLDQEPRERLRLDLTGFDCQLFVEQLLALVNSRRVDTQSDAVNRFGEHVQRLRYEDGRVDYCHRHHYFSRWAEAAERQGYLVTLTPYLPGAVTRTVRLTWMSEHPGSYRPLRQPANRACITALEQGLSVRQSYLPLAQLGPALASLRDGDLFALVTRLPGLDVTHVGLLKREGAAVAAIHAAPGRGVMRSPDLARYAAGVRDVVGVMVLRPMPNPDGRPGS